MRYKSKTNCFRVSGLIYIGIEETLDEDLRHRFVPSSARRRIQVWPKVFSGTGFAASGVPIFDFFGSGYSRKVWTLSSNRSLVCFLTSRCTVLIGWLSSSNRVKEHTEVLFWLLFLWQTGPVVRRGGMISSSSSASESSSEPIGLCLPEVR